MFAIGTVFVAFAWLASYPVTIAPVGRYLFDGIYPSLWPGLSIVFASLFLISQSSRDRRVALICAIGLVFFLYVDYLFFQLLPGPDAHYFRALTKLSATAGVSTSNAEYFQWPSFFVLNNVLSSVLGLNVDNVSVLFFVYTGLALSSTLFVYYSSQVENMGFVGVALYFIGLFWFLNYQFAPQSLALVLLLVCVNLATRTDRGSKICLLLVFVSLAFMHAFMPVFFLLFYFIITLRDRTRRNSFILYSIIFLAELVYLALRNLNYLITMFQQIAFLTSYSWIVQSTFVPVLAPIDVVAQFFSRGITVLVWGLLLVGMVIRAVKKDIRVRDVSLLAAGSLYALVGGVVAVLGQRSLQLVFVPFASGGKPFLKRYHKFITGFLLLALILSPFLVIHSIYDTTSVQTASGERASEVLIRNLSGRVFLTVLATAEDGYYISGRLSESDVFAAHLNIVTVPSASSGPTLLLNNYDYVIYGHTFEKSAAYASYLSSAEIYGIRSHFIGNYSRIWDDGQDSILMGRLPVP
jgi:hypothetical protein